jgi:lipoprotein-releasing system permease protein
MFEISVASKYLLPRRRQLSVSIISLISTLVISLVVWLIVVFFSVTDGLEKNWIHKLTALTAPVRITPTEAYYHSYYYQIDSISDASSYSHKTIREKQESNLTDPYDSNHDEEIPTYWPIPDHQPDGSLKDLVKLVYTSIDEIKGIPEIKAQDYELTVSHIRLRLLRELSLPYLNRAYGGITQSFLSYPAYLGNFESDNRKLNQTLLPLRMSDLNNLFSLLGVAEDATREDSSGERLFFAPAILQKRLKDFFQTIEITQLKTLPSGWRIPPALLPSGVQWAVCAVLKDNKIVRIVVPTDVTQLKALQDSLDEQGFSIVISKLWLQQQPTIEIPGQEPRLIPARMPITLSAHTQFPAQVVLSSIEKVQRLEDLLFDVSLSIQGAAIKGVVPYRGLEIGSVNFNSVMTPTSPLWAHPIITDNQVTQFILPKDPDIGEGVLLPKSFKEAGVLVGDRGYLTYYSPTTSVILEQHLPIYVAAFYDPGIIPIGGKFILANPSVTSLIRASHNQEEKGITNGINVRFNQIHKVNEVKAQLLQAFKEKGISRYWNVETYREYEFTKEIMNELQSQKNLFTLIAIVIIVVACSNIISMLIILVNDKKLEIGILRSMGATSKSIALIFGLAGGLIGVIGSIIGISAAILTLNHLQTLVGFISRLQGHEMFSSSFYGEVLPHELSYEALLFVLIATMIISLLAGIVPAVKACLLRPSHILRSTGE